MQHHLDTKVILSVDSEHNSLYQWFLREVGDEASEYQRDQIPWRWSQYFTLSEINVHSSFQLGDHYATDVEKAAAQVKEHDFIRAKLLPYDVRDGHLCSYTRYSMFGTNRAIPEFELSITQVEDGESESCQAWGSVSYTAEIDFDDITTDDNITFDLRVSKERFARLLRLITTKSISGGGLSISDADGFYSNWSPSISTDAIKVLTPDEKYHPVEVPEGCSIVPPRLGKIGEFVLYLNDGLKFQLPQETVYDDDLEDEGPSQPVQSESDMPVVRLMADAKTLGVLQSLRIAAWIIAALLILILIK